MDIRANITPMALGTLQRRMSAVPPLVVWLLLDVALFTRLRVRENVLRANYPNYENNN